MYMNMYARSLNHRRTSAPEEPPKNKYFIVILQTFNVFITLLVLHVYWRANQIEEIASYYWFILAAFTAILVVFAVIKFLICYIDHRNPEGYSPKNRCRRDLLIGYGAISICGYIPIIVMYIFGYHPFLGISAFICYIPPGLIIPLFILQHLRKYQVCHNSFPESLVGWIRAPVIARIALRKTLLKLSNATECHICLLRYSSLVIPRILIGCGHTICEKCVGKLPRLGEHQNRVLCPFCRNSTRLPGGRPEQLPKNFTVLDIVMEQRNQRR
ncbi:hypothetical protein CAEBREN_06989 [Caenorhabditis brenneri]|uniref:RING-type domain-containing protein n=1 Tax=Caenorhabditis brenneri TaxID=135651 RepID=G0N7Z1_CAEBE|nr:hypothetical protein CAEBREN_06989 [Caenorhabditis brenneri]